MSIKNEKILHMSGLSTETSHAQYLNKLFIMSIFSLL